MSIFDKFRKMLGGQSDKSAPGNPVAASGPDAGSSQQHDDAAFVQSCARRDAYWATVGSVETDVLGHLISPGLMGGPAWPTTRQAYRVIRRANTIVIATDGMSDPFDDPSREGNGFGMELFIETANILPEHAGAVGDISKLSRSWAFELVSQVAGTIAQAGGIVGQLQRYGVLSMELPGVSQSHAIGAQVPKRYVTADDCVGILLGMPVTGFPTRIEDMPLSPVVIVPVTLIAADELEQLRQGGGAARKALAEALVASGAGHLSNLRQ
jgi:hypothetical protein